ncbi:hypothetical protein D3871_10850 [Noviherbaspirillum saxi]|uniref:Uncharacterized protein n=2 Tax=Noviherbaspirillum saxi TaxID=2320863 RepID=A0A3A3FT43_9BURK|nr:hypothetical protein D3871_10850 [Noviherbaspirillum saxi]
MPKFAYMAAVFVVGAAVGVGSAWWLNPHAQTDRADGVPGISAGKPSYSALAATAESSVASQSSGVRGISRSELPYDGAPPDAVAEPETAAASSPGARSSSKTAEDRVVQNAITQAERQRSQDTKPELPMSPSARRAPSLAEMPSTANMAEQHSRPSARVETRAHAVVPKRQPDSKMAKDLEIERIRRQADEELKKKTEAKRRLAEVRERKSAPTQRASSQVSTSGGILKTRSTQMMLAQCEQASNFFLREQCKWKLCNGMWGKNGCPSYNRPVGNSAY